VAMKSSGNCYLCGAELGKTAMKNHLLSAHGEEDGQECCLLKIEGAENANYWLFIDVPMEKTLAAVDKFLRKIWLECCDHMSKFCLSHWGSALGMTRKLNTFDAGSKFFHQYDFGASTDTLITVVGTTTRKPQKDIVRLLARNVPAVFECADCKKPAKYICIEQVEPYDMPFYCADCGEKREDDDHYMMLVTNSPRMGECGYEGELDTFEFDPRPFAQAGEALEKPAGDAKLRKSAKAKQAGSSGIHG